MSKLSVILGTMMGGAGKQYCPDCGSEMKPNGTCPDCGYGEEDNGMESDENNEMQALLDIKDELQRVIEKVNRLITNAD